MVLRGFCCDHRTYVSRRGRWIEVWGEYLVQVPEHKPLNRGGGENANVSEQTQVPHYVSHVVLEWCCRHGQEHVFSEASYQH